MFVLRVCVFFLCFCLSGFAQAEEVKDYYFCSTKFTYVSVREAPCYTSYVKFVYTAKNEPVKVVRSFWNWRKIRDIDGHTGWVHAMSLSDARYIIITATKPIILYDDLKRKNIKAYIEPNVRCKLITFNLNWCKVKVENYSGWIARVGLWGLD